MSELIIESNKNKAELQKIAQAVYKTLKQKANLKAELVYFEEDEMRELNKRTRGIDKVTDVLSYPALDGIRGKILKSKDYAFELDEGYIFIGSIVLCNQKIKEQAKEYGHSEKIERQYLTVHGLMHLMGYDHMTEEDKKEMRVQEKKALALLGVKD